MNEIYKGHLQAIHDSCNSFYGKAKIIEEGTRTKLKSYDTIVAIYDHRENKMSIGTDEMPVEKWSTRTTRRHINEFLLQYGYDKATKNEIENWAINNK